MQEADSLEYVEAPGSVESSLTCLRWTCKKLPETEFVFLTATLIALEQLPSERSNKPGAIQSKRYLPNLQSSCCELCDAFDGKNNLKFTWTCSLIRPI